MTNNLVIFIIRSTSLLLGTFSTYVLYDQKETSIVEALPSTTTSTVTVLVASDRMLAVAFEGTPPLVGTKSQANVRRPDASCALQDSTGLALYVPYLGECQPWSTGLVCPMMTSTLSQLLPPRMPTAVALTMSRPTRVVLSTMRVVVPPLRGDSGTIMVELGWACHSASTDRARSESTRSTTTQKRPR